MEHASKQNKADLCCLAHDLASPLTAIRLDLERLQLETANNHPIWHRIYYGLSAINSRLEQGMVAGGAPKKKHPRLQCAQPKLQTAAAGHIYSGQRHGHNRSWSLQTLLEEVIVFNGSALETAAIRLERDLQKDATLVGRRSVMFLSIHNLVLNAIQVLTYHGDRPGVIRVRMDHFHGKVRLQIADNGPGIPRGYLSQLFRVPFSTRPGGHGLGLPAVARNLRREFNGKISYCRDAKLGGACFTIQL